MLNQKNIIFAKFVVAVVLIVCLGCVRRPILNIEERLLPVSNDGNSFTQSEIKTAILTGCKTRGWIPSVKSNGAIEAFIYVRERYEAVINIAYTENTLSISYVSSENLKYNNGKIHRNYNKWIALLYNSINHQLGVR